MSSKFFTNSNERNLFDKFTGILQNMKDLYAFHAVVGYFRSSGYFQLQKHLKEVKSIKILVGINVDQMFAEAQRKGMIFFGDQERTKEEFLKWFIQDIKEAKYSKEVEGGILQFVNDLMDGRIEVRAHKSQAIHAKFYLFLPEHHSEHTDGWVIMGSSNLTDAGLGIKKSSNYELNISIKDYEDVQFTKQQFEELWKDSTPILPADIQAFKQKTHIGQTFTPFELYIKFLIEYFGKNIDYDPDTVGDLPKTFKKLSYQVDAVNQGFQMLLDHNGFFLADVVGLGKTVVAAMIAKRFLIANGSLNTKILVVYPPALEKNWKTTFKTFNIDKHCKFITNGRLDKILEGNSHDYWPKEEYDLVLVDEAHRYRNHTSTMFANLQRICKSGRANEGLVKGNKKKVMLISATPLNNRPQDLYYLLLLFQDARQSTLSETNLQSFFAPIIKEYKEIIASPSPDIERIREIYTHIRKKIIEQISVRRTRKNLDNFPAYKSDLAEQGIIFPEIAAPKAKIYQLDPKLAKIFYKTVFTLTEDVNYFRYQAIRFLSDEKQDDAGYTQAELISRSLAGIMNTLLVKRLESSFHAFRISLKNLTTATKRMIEMFEKDKVLIAPDLRVNDLQEKGMSVEEIEDIINELSITNPRNNIFESADFVEREISTEKPIYTTLIAGLKEDYRLLSELEMIWQSVKEDPKLDEFLKVYQNELLREDINPTGKLVIFTESTDTANYLQEKLEASAKIKTLCVSSDNRSKVFDTILENFDANYTGTPKNDYNVIITTDVLAEGINLHRANVIVNYDTPWNATRLMQRIGRVNRIGSVAGVIYNYNFYPSQEGDQEIKLYNNSLVKLQGFHSAFGEDAQIYSHEELVEQFELFKNDLPDDEDKRLKYLKIIREFKESNPKEFKRIKAFPLKARTARNSKNLTDKELKNNSVVFLKSPYKLEFYQVLPNQKVNPLTFIEAAELFEATAAEVPASIPSFHFEQVQAALHAFEQDFMNSSSEMVTSTDKADAITAQARKFLRDIKGITTNKAVKTACDNLNQFLEKGTFTPLPNELKKMKTQLGKKIILGGQLDEKLMTLARKYDALEKEQQGEEPLSMIETNITPDIVLSETFIG
ncbi:MAG: helicase-related protein [Cytophagales bacterium]